MNTEALLCYNFLMQKIIIVGSTHGHEKIGQKVAEELKKILPEINQVQFLIGNPQASEKNIPFVESDLNRVFPGKAGGDYEEKRAFELSKEIISADLVIDIHSTNTTDYSTNSMLIVTKFDKATEDLIKIINPPKVLVMKYKNDKALISQAKVGIAFEYGVDTSLKVLEVTLHDIANLFIHFGILKNNPYQKVELNCKTEIYEVYDAFEKTFEGKFVRDSRLINFQKVEKGMAIGLTETGAQVEASEDFYPIMFGENRYTTILGFKAKKL